MTSQSLLPFALIASICGAAAAVSLPEGTTSAVLARSGTRAATQALDDRGGWSFTENPPDGSGGALIIRHMARGEGKPANPSVFAREANGLLDTARVAMLYHDGVLYVACAPRLMMLRDADGDGVAEQRKVIQDGFGTGTPGLGHGFGGLALGPDGRIYGTIGDAGMDFTTREGAVCRFPDRGAAFRFESDGSGFECFHTGLRDPGRIAFDDAGNAFTIDAGPGPNRSARVVQVVDGGNSGWRVNHGGVPSPPEESSLGSAPARRSSGGQSASILPSSGGLDARPSGFAVHPGAGYLENALGRSFVGDLRRSRDESAVWSFGIKSEGAGAVIDGARRELTGISPSWVEFSPDGRLWITDEVDGTVIAVDAGVETWLASEAAGAAKLFKDGFHHRSSAELVHLLRHPDSRVRLYSQLALVRKKDALERLGEAAVSSNATVRAHAIRGLAILARGGPMPMPFEDFAAIPSGNDLAGALKILVKLTEDNDERIRCEALRALASAKADAPELNLALLLDDESPRVRSLAALVVARRKLAGYFDPVCQMLDKNDNKDPWLRQAGAFALEQMTQDTSLLSALAEHGSPAVRLAAVIGLRRIESPDVSAFLDDPDPRVADEAGCDPDPAGIHHENAPVVPSPAVLAETPAGGWEAEMPQKTDNPWLIIIIGMLVVTGILLYVDPRIF